MLSDFKPHFIGVPDGTADGQREFRTPTLRNLRHTAPYMHNGSLRTVRDVLVVYEDLQETVSESFDGGLATSQRPLDPLLKRMQISSADFPALEAFLDSLSSQDYDQSIPATVPSGLPVLSAR